jgi:hypothetical protein
MNHDNLHKALNRIDGVAMKLPISQESKTRLRDYMESMKKNMDRAPLVYRTIFLSPELETCRKLYRPARVTTMVTKQEETVTEKTVRQFSG